MSKYEALWVYLKNSPLKRMKLTFDEVAEISKTKLDHSFLNYKKEAAAYGWMVGKISIKEQNVSFERIEEN